ncbi:MAG: hydroxymethylglutaryl-CoA synthase [Candidatus Helarchaeota archaeon]|nr:hydroxymethylglutaryl-CoA synthase [Candidatus Helarchaeota archaeon]
MPGIIGYGVYLPYYRIKFSDIAEAWNRKIKLPSEKTVPAPDETPLTMARNAVVNAIKHANIPSEDIGAVYYCSNSSPIEGSSAQDIAIVASLNSDASVVDLHSSPRSLTTAIRMCLDAINVKRIKYGLVVGADILVGGLGTSAGDIASEYVSAAGAGAIILGTDGIIADLEEITSYMTGMKERWRDLKDQFPHVGDGRFIRDFGYIAHVVKTGKMLLEKINRPIDEFKHILLQQPHAQWVQRALGKLGISREALKAKLTAPGMHINKFGDLGAACLPVALAEVLDKAQPEEKILTISYGAGGSDALSWIVKSSINNKRDRTTPVEKFLKYKEYVNYTTHLKYNKVISQFI